MVIISIHRDVPNQGRWFTSIIIQAARRHLVYLNLGNLGNLGNKEIKLQCRQLSEHWCSLILTSLNMKISNSFCFIYFKSSSYGIINIFLNSDIQTKYNNSESINKKPSSLITTNHINSSILETFPATIIGTIYSCFKTKYASPRQGSFAPSSRGVVQLNRQLSPEFLDGLDEFSHCWLIWLFHQASTDQLKPKIRPPKLDGSRIGVFSTRSPHRLVSSGSKIMAKIVAEIMTIMAKIMAEIMVFVYLRI